MPTISVDDVVYSHHDVRAMRDRIKTLEGHRNQWRNIAFRTLEVLDEVNSWADPPETVQERLREVRALFEDTQRQSEETKGERGT